MAPEGKTTLLRRVLVEKPELAQAEMIVPALHINAREHPVTSAEGLRTTLLRCGAAFEKAWKRLLAAQSPDAQLMLNRPELFSVGPKMPPPSAPLDDVLGWISEQLATMTPRADAGASPRPVIFIDHVHRLDAWKAEDAEDSTAFLDFLVHVSARLAAHPPPARSRLQGPGGPS